MSIAAALAAFIGACGSAPTDTAEPAPPPGQGAGGGGRLELVSAAPVPPAPNLLTNGGFEQWVVGSNGPAGFGAPSGTHSTVAQEAEATVSGEYAVKQTWSSSDGADSFWNCFHVVASDIQPASTYEFSVQAWNRSQNRIVVIASKVEFGPGPSTPLKKIDNILVIDPADGFNEHATTFQTPANDGPMQVLISVATLGQGTYPAEVVWDDWSLRRVRPWEVAAAE